ncbi:MAG: hypothetical protein KKB30_11865 [Proteobacteria bacterium]|nr:hypothetical protein [Pseudomonadota bacterium]MBU1714409.1 hypothetical protein [Pseudomonadota bacterium]
MATKSPSAISVEDWFELLVESGVVPGVKLENLLSEANELTAIFVTIIKNTKKNNS